MEPALPEWNNVLVSPFADWFSLELLEAYLSAQEQLRNGSTTVELSLHEQDFTLFDAPPLDKIPKAFFTIEASVLDKAAKAIEEASSRTRVHLESGGTLPSADKLAYSAHFARALDVLLFHKDSEVGACLHHAPVSGSEADPCDVMVVPLADQGGPVLVGDMHSEDLAQAESETARPANALMRWRVEHLEEWVVRIGLSGTRTELSMQLCMPSGLSFWCVPVVKSSPTDRALLCTLYAGVQFLLKMHALAVDHPPRRMVLEQFLERVIRNQEYVLKWFDSEVWPFRKVNKSVMDLLNIPYEELLHYHPLTILKLPFIDGSHKPEGPEHFSGALKQLSVLHDNNIVHGDIRLSNIIFDKIGSSHLIDFELAGKEDIDHYPSGYNCFNIRERHPGAKPGGLMRMDHDKYSMLYLINNKFPNSLPESVLSKDPKDWLKELTPSV